MLDHPGASKIAWLAVALAALVGCTSTAPTHNTTGDAAANPGGATCGPLSSGQYGHGIAVCAACLRASCCAELRACDDDADCAACTRGDDPTDPRACNGDPEFGRPDGAYNRLVLCESARCVEGNECTGVAGSTCTPSDCAPSCERYPDCR